MANLYAFTPKLPQVKVVFEDGSHCFLLDQGATMSELADRINVLSLKHMDAPVAIHVELDISNFWPRRKVPAIEATKN
jgi:hypothetical protein